MILKFNVCRHNARFIYIQLSLMYIRLQRITVMISTIISHLSDVRSTASSKTIPPLNYNQVFIYSTACGIYVHVPVKAN
jgi:hypothetical protein